MLSVKIANISFWVLWIWALTWCRTNCFDDPSSFFFDADNAYTARYSVKRIQQADDFLRLHRLKHLAIDPKAGTQRKSSSAERFLCIAIPSANRGSDVYLSRTLASLIDNLTPEQRDSIIIKVLLAENDAAKHISHHYKWLSDLVDEVLVYESGANPLDEPPKYTTVRNSGKAKRGNNTVQNNRLDHAVLVDSCQTWGGKYTALIDDDIIASPDWFGMLTKGATQVQQHSQRLSYEWLYLRLFYTDLFIRWTWEEAISSVEMIFVLYFAIFVVFLGARRYCRICPNEGKGSAKLITSQTFNQMCLVVISIWVPALIALYFIAGRMVFNRLTLFPFSGVREMPKYGCCGQGLVVPQHQLEGLATMLRAPPFDFATDQMVELYADQKNFHKFTLDTSVLQHVGPMDSKIGPDKRVWNFGFERRTNPAPVLT